MRLIAAVLCLLATLARAADYRAGPEDYRPLLPRLQAGDRLSLYPGDYLRGLPLKGLSGTAERPIVIEGPDSGPPARFLARAGANTVSLTDVRHITIRRLELDGRNLPVDAVKAEGNGSYADHVTLEGLYIHDHAASQQNVGISTKSPARGWVVRGNRIERVGTGMYFGNSDGSDPFVAGLIEYNLVTDTLGYNLQIKHQRSRPADAGSYPQATVIRHNVFAKAGGGNPPPTARPNVLLGHWPPEGPGADDRYLVYGNLFYENPNESLFQAEGNVALYANLFVTHGPDAIRIQPHNDVPRDVRILYNTVVAQGNGITVRTRPENAYAQVVGNNVAFAARPIEGGVQQGNFTGDHADAGRFLMRPFAPPGEMDLAPGPAVRVTEFAEWHWFEGLPDVYLDFEGKPRESGVVGAYGSLGDPALWRPMIGFKPPWTRP